MENIEQSKEIQEARSVVEGNLASASALTIADDFGIKQAGIIAKNVAEQKRNLEKQRQFFVRPLNEQVGKINTLFREITAPLQQADTLVREKVSAYRRIQTELAQKEQERQNKLADKRQETANKRAEQAGVEAPVITAPVVSQPAAKVGNVGTRKDWVFHVTDPALVPAAYLAVDEKKIREAVRSGVREISGVRIFQEETIVIH